MEHAEVIVAGVAAGEDCAELSDGVWPLSFGYEELRFVEGLFESGEEGVGIFASRGEIRAGDGCGFDRTTLPPFPAE